MNIFTATLLLHNLPSATHPSLLSAKTFFIAARNATVLFDEDNKATIFFHSVIFNSVIKPDSLLHLKNLSSA